MADNGAMIELNFLDFVEPYDALQSEGTEILKSLAASLGYDYPLLADRNGKCIVTFGKHGLMAAAYAVDEFCKPLCIERRNYNDAARMLHKILDSGRAVFVGSRMLVSSMAPKFMMDCVLAGLV